VKLYESLAADIAGLIEQGVLREGDRIQSVRQASQHHNLSVSTVIRAYLLLESRGLIESRPQSGYFVRAMQARPGAEPAAVPQAARATEAARAPQLDAAKLILATLRSIREGSVPFGSPYPDPELFPSSRLNSYAGSVGRQHPSGLMADLPPGDPELIRQIARRHLDNGLAVDPGEIVITVGATEALNLCLQAVARPGAAVAVESPSYIPVRQSLARFGMRAVEIPTDAVHGIDLDLLERAIVNDGLVAAVVMPNFQNPLGCRMSESHKDALVALMHRHAVPLIENGVYDELYFGDSPPSTLKSRDRDGLVMHCNSFSKNLTASQHIGWMLTGRYRAQVEALKLFNTLGTPVLPQLVIAQYLRQDGYDFHLRRLRRHLSQQARMMVAAVRRFFPPGTRLATPDGGYLLWVGLPAGVKALALFARAQERGISLAPGDIFGSDPSLANYIRLNYSYPWTADTDAALRTLGLLAGELATGTGAGKDHSTLPARD
jgi:DNA-binding transcriptional MocR family regulator